MRRKGRSQVRVSIVEGSGAGKSFDFEDDELTIGRASSNTILLTDEFVSHRHGRISRQEGRYVYTDLDSTNGSVIARGEQRWELSGAVREHVLEHGDRIVLGHTVLRIALEAPTVGETVTATTDISRLADTDTSVRAERDTLLAIYEMERRIHLELDPSKLVKTVLRAVLDAFPRATSASVGFIDLDSLEVTGVTSLTASGQEVIPVSRSMARRALEERTALCFENAQVALPTAHSVIASGVQCAMCAPLWTGTEMRGVLQVATRAAPQCFSDRDLGLFTVFANRAAIALANAELNEERQRTANFRELTDYLANELRSAATGLVEWLKPLEDGDFGKIDDLQLEAVRMARLGAQMVSTLVTSMTDLAQLKQPGLVLETTSVRLDEAAEVPFRLAQARAKMEGVELRSALAPEVPPASADLQLLQRVVLNLLFFAMAWADRSAPMRIASEPGDDGPVLAVEWSGEPVPAEYLERIFDPDTQARLWKELGRRSVGIGLAFCKVAVETMRGRIWLESSASANAVKVSLPRA